MPEWEVIASWVGSLNFPQGLRIYYILSFKTITQLEMWCLSSKRMTHWMEVLSNFLNKAEERFCRQDKLPIKAWLAIWKKLMILKVGEPRMWSEKCTLRTSWNIAYMFSHNSLTTQSHFIVCRELCYTFTLKTVLFEPNILITGNKMSLKKALHTYYYLARWVQTLNW